MTFQMYLFNYSKSPIRLMCPELDEKAYVPIDLSADSRDLKTYHLHSSLTFSDFIKNHLESHQKKIAFGGYLEKRQLYSRSSHFSSQNPEYQRNIHLGVDLWCAEATPVLAAFDGEVHSFKNNTAFGDYGPTIILKHSVNGMTFFSLYGHLSLASIAPLKVGKKINAGDVIGYLGGPDINGDYPPHLHFQLIKDMQGNVGDYPGVCCEKELEFYKQNCPDPNLFLKLTH